MSVATFHAPSHTGASLAQVLRPFALIAALAFLAGFGGYLILGPPNVMGMVSDQARAAAASSAATPASAPADDWNFPKKI
jgi:hypothetical protein